MRTIDLRRIIEQNHLDWGEISTELFPKNKQPRRALDRVAKGEALLDSEQISRLATLLGVEIQDLYMGYEWKATSKPGLITLTTDKFRAEIDTKKWSLKVYASDKLFHDEVLMSPTIQLSELLKNLNQIIEKYE